jgi:hypothetical protein
MNKQRKTSNILNVFQYNETTGAVTLPSTLDLTAPGSSDDSTKAPTTAWVRALISSLGYVTLASDQTITGLKTIVRSGDVLNFKIGTDNLYALKIVYNQNELVESGEATWSFANTFNNGSGTGITTTPISFFRGVLVTGQRLLSASVNTNLIAYYGNNPSGRYPVFAYNTGVQQFASSIIVGDATGVVNAATGAIADLPAGVVANFKGRVIGSNAVNNNEFVTLGQIPSLTGYVTGTGSSGQVGYFTGTSAIASGSNFLFDASQRNLTIDRSLSTLGNAITISKLSDADQAWLTFRQGGGSSGTWRLGYTGVVYDFRINVGSDGSIGTQALRIFQSTQNVVIGTATSDPNFKLDVNGTGRFSGALTGTSASFSGIVTAQQSNITADGAGVVLQGYVDNNLRIAVRGSGYNSGSRGGLLASTGDFSGSVGAGGGAVYSNLESSSATFGSTVPLMSLAIKDGTYNPRTTISYRTQTGSAYSVVFDSGYSSGWAATNYIFASGNVGIGASSLLEKLSVNGNIHVEGVGNSIYFDTDGTGRSIQQFVANQYQFHIVNARGNSARFILGNSSISLGTSSTPQFNINTTNGNIGIGTVSDNGRKLNVNGSGLFSGTLSTAKVEVGAVESVNITTNSTFTLVSSSYFNIRTNILISVTIRWNNNANSQRQYLLFIGATDTGWGTPNSAISVIASNDWSSGYVGAATFSIGGSGALRTLNISVANAATYNVTANASIIDM